MLSTREQPRPLITMGVGGHSVPLFEAMPPLAQWIGAAFPITYYLRVLRGILLKGVGMDALWRDTLALAAFAVVLLVFSVRRFRKNIE